MYPSSKQAELIRFSRVGAGSTVIDVYPGDGDWTRLFSDIVGPAGRVCSFVPAAVAHFKNDPVGRMQTLAKEPGRENVEAVSALGQGRRGNLALALSFLCAQRSFLIQSRGKADVYDRRSAALFANYLLLHPPRTKVSRQLAKPKFASTMQCSFSDWCARNGE